jgi:hypothetical protein
MQEFTTSRIPTPPTEQINTLWNKKVLSEPIFILTAFCALLLLLILILHFPLKPKPIRWEYKIVKYFNQGYERTGSEAGKYSSVIVPENELNELGKQGWELVSTTLEMETSYPNFGSAEYVTGIQPNVRPQDIICIFKKPL